MDSEVLSWHAHHSLEDLDAGWAYVAFRRGKPGCFFSARNTLSPGDYLVRMMQDLPISTSSAGPGARGVAAGMGWTGMQGTHSSLAACCPARRLAPLLPSILYALACEEAQSHLSLLDGLAGANVRRC